MQLIRLRVCNFQSFGSDPVVMELDRMTYLIGPNGVGKTTFLQALARMFGVDRSLRGVRRTDFHLDADGRTASELWIEADFELPEAGDEGAESRTVPSFFNHMQLEHADGPATLRIRLTAILEVDDEVEEKLEHVTQADEDGEPLTTYGVSRLDRRQIEFHYLPARRDPATHLTYTASSLLGRALRAVDWKEQRDEVIDLTSKIDDTLKLSEAITSLGEHLQTQWKGVYTGDFFKTVEVAFNQRDLVLDGIPCEDGAACVAAVRLRTVTRVGGERRRVRVRRHSDHVLVAQRPSLFLGRMGGPFLGADGGTRGHGR